MLRKVRPGSRWISSPRKTTCHSYTHLKEREQQNRRIRRCRLPGEPSGATPPVPGRMLADLLATLRCYCDTLQRQGDSYEAWIGLSEIFAALDDHERVRRCRHVASLLA